MKIELLHPITHGVGPDVTTYSRGVHDLPQPLAEYFVTHKDNAHGGPIARLADESKGSVAAGRALKEPKRVRTASQQAAADARLAEENKGSVAVGRAVEEPKRVRTDSPQAASDAAKPRER